MKELHGGGTVLLCLRTIFLAGGTDSLSGVCKIQPGAVCPVWRSRLMLKVRLMGTKNDITWFGKILNNNSKIEVTEFSDLYPNKGTKKFYRAYVEVRKSNVAEKS